MAIPLMEDLTVYQEFLRSHTGYFGISAGLGVAWEEKEMCRL